MKSVKNKFQTCEFYVTLPAEIYNTGCTSPEGIRHHNFITISSKEGLVYAPMGSGAPNCRFDKGCPCRDEEII